MCPCGSCRWSANFIQSAEGILRAKAEKFCLTLQCQVGSEFPAWGGSCLWIPAWGRSQLSSSVVGATATTRRSWGPSITSQVKERRHQVGVWFSVTSCPAKSLAPSQSLPSALWEGISQHPLFKSILHP